LVQRGYDDKHICFELLSNDDGHWSIFNGHASSYWIPEIQELFVEVNKWMANNCVSDIHDGHVFGFKLT